MQGPRFHHPRPLSPSPEDVAEVDAAGEEEEGGEDGGDELGAAAPAAAPAGPDLDLADAPP